MPIQRSRIRFLDDQVPNNDGYRSYLKDRVLAFAEEDPDNHGLASCVAAIVQNCGHSSVSDRRNHATVKFYVVGADGKAQFLVTQHVTCLKYRTWSQRQQRRRRGGGGGGSR
ncbi:uncharacterized protein C8A04DRAFT_28118 [Dichotomopilus funicola]|uniref:Uncharacterized protein n=1 Tax=Dichotomopilus funicola TaxID=1934379 RepID=A0AAN6ZP59_9PEZI|nr:hypothetical protein C8A04DRAFT_28118 [Dichotomopilus funicola]